MEPILRRPEELVVRPGRSLAGTPDLPGDKSISHRALLFAALADGETAVHGLSTCADVARTLGCLASLSVRVEQGPEGAWIVHGQGPAGLRSMGGARDLTNIGEPPGGLDDLGNWLALDCGDSGTTMRLLAGILAGQPGGRYRLDAAEGLAGRPMQRVVEPLVAMGGRVRTLEGRPPIWVEGGPLVGVEWTLATASAQVGSAVLLAGLNATGTTCVHYPSPVRDHTERLLAEMGAPIRWQGTTTWLDGLVQSLRPAGEGRMQVPGDPSAAAYLLAAAILVPGSRVRLDGVGVNPGRTGFLDILRRMGARLSESDGTLRHGEPIATLEALAGPLVATTVDGSLVSRAIDELPLVAVLATQAQGRTVVREAAELRVKECDRIEATVDGLRRMGARIEARPDGFVVEGPTPLHGTAVDGYGDHRIVMAMVVAGLVADGVTVVSDGDRVGDSFPGFVAAMTSLGADVRSEWVGGDA